MPPRTALAVASSIFNFSRLLRSLPSTGAPQTFTRCSACLFSTTPYLESISKKKKKKPRRRMDPYRAAQARQRKAANLARQDVLQRERQEALGDPIRSRPTPTLQALLNPSAPQSDLNADGRINFFLDRKMFNETLEHSEWLTEPLPPENENQLDPEELQKQQQIHAKKHENAERALSTIMNLDNGSSRDRTRVSIQRCVDIFGRHITDDILPPKPASLDNSGMIATSKIRAGPDTGSSEVQAAILTAKINVLADNLGKKDKHNKRNLRLLVHRRQKLLSYLRRKERGGPRWQNLVEKLGISDAMWKGEISL